MLGACCLELGARGRGSWSLVLEACRLQLGASSFPREARHNISGGKRSLAAIIHFFVIIV